MARFGLTHTVAWQSHCTIALQIMFANFDMALSWSELMKRTARKTMSDDAQGLASQLAYYFFLALFPALLCLLAIASFFPLQNVTDDMVRLLGPFAPREMLEIIRQEMAKIAEGQHGGLLTVGLLGALWSSSSAMVAVIGAMNRAYDIDEGRPWWKVRLTAIGLTVGALVVDHRRIHADRRRTAAGRLHRTSSGVRRGVRLDLEDHSMAARVCAGCRRDWLDLLLRAGCGAVLGLDYAGLARRDVAVVDRIAGISVLRRQLW